MMQKSTTFTTIFSVKKCYFLYDFSCKKVSKKNMDVILKKLKMFLHHVQCEEFWRHELFRNLIANLYNTIKYSFHKLLLLIS
jgi:hypothetical protein